MKKTILLTSLLASVATMAAGTTGSVEAYNSNETGYQSGHDFITDFNGTKSTFGVKTEVKVKDTGLSFGADVKAKDYKIFGLKNEDNEKFLAKVKAESSVWAKYELPEIENVKSYVKAEYKTKGEINVEGDAAYKLAEKLNLGLNSKTEFGLSGALTPANVKSTHKAYLKGEYDKVKDIYAELGVNHDYTTANQAKNVFLNAKASYEAMKDLTLTGKFDFKYAFDNMLDDDSLLYSNHKSTINLFNGPNVKDKLKGKYRHSYLLGFKYTGVKDTELKLDAFIEHNFIANNLAALNFGFKPEVTYKGIPNLVLSSKNILGGTAGFVANSEYSGTSGYVLLNANAEYAYAVTDKLTVKPSLDLTSEFIVPQPTSGLISLFEITPKVKAEYKPAESLTISGDISPVIRFAGVADDFKYKSTTVKSNLNVKYTW